MVKKYFLFTSSVLKTKQLLDIILVCADADIVHLIPTQNGLYLRKAPYPLRQTAATFGGRGSTIPDRYASRILIRLHRESPFTRIIYSYYERYDVPLKS